jgi:coenzyme F420 hydrogenase subunit beta
MQLKIRHDMTESRELNETVIKNGYCIGCGACSAIKNSPFTMGLDHFGNMTALFKEESLDKSTVKVLEVCPFSESSKNENELGEFFFPSIDKKNEKIGKYISSYAGYVRHKDFREKGSSGGIGKWIGAILLENNEIDYFVQLKANDSNEPNKLLFKYAVFTNADEVVKGSKSAYYPTTLNSVIDVIRNKQGRYAVTGVPCNIKALRLLSLEDSILKERIKFTIGIICGGMKSANQSLMIGWQLGIKPKDLDGIDFRRKYKNRPADQKIYAVLSKADKKERFKDASEIYGTDYGAGFFKPKACDYCDDVVAETADISVGDAWLNDFSKDPRGNSLIIVRNQKLEDLLIKYNKEGVLHLNKISEEEAAQAQAGGFRHRREGLSYRISKKELKKEWYPPKRVSPDQYSLDSKRKLIYDLREEISEKSHISFLKALRNNDLSIFYNEMKPIFNRYKGLNESGKIRLILRKIKRIFIYDVLKGPRLK